MTDLLTGPERATERGIAKRKRAKIYAAGGCGVCIHRDRNVEGWGRSICATAGRTFPRCIHTPGTQFEIDHTKLKGNPNASSK